MAGRDLTKTLDPKETARLRTLLAQHPEIEADPDEGGEYPKILYAEAFVAAQAAFIEHIDPLVKKTAHEDMKKHCRTVFDLEEEQELLEDGWRGSPADFMRVDPRIPVGREGRRVAQVARVSVLDEIAALQRRLVELTAMASAQGIDPVAETARKAPQPLGHKSKAARTQTRRAAAAQAHA